MHQNASNRILNFKKKFRSNTCALEASAPELQEGKEQRESEGIARIQMSYIIAFMQFLAACETFACRHGV